MLSTSMSTLTAVGRKPKMVLIREKTRQTTNAFTAVLRSQGLGSTSRI